VTVDGEERPVVFVVATEQDAAHGEMGNLYLRDHIYVGQAMMRLYQQDPVRYAKEGRQARQLLTSMLHLFSTEGQLQHLDDTTALGPEAGQENWPNITLWLNDLEATEPNGWRNIQDTLAIGGNWICEAFETGFSRPDMLLNAHKKFLSSIAPLLHSVGYPHYENSGSWEEMAAKRNSALAPEISFLNRMQALADTNPAFAFMRGGLSHEKIDDMIVDGLHEYGRRLPDEAPDYPKDSVKYRQADAAGVYGLMYGLPQLLAERNIAIGDTGRSMTESEIEDLMLDKLASLDDPATNGSRRYEGDSYQRFNFCTETVQTVIKAIKRRVKHEAEQAKRGIDLELKQRLRHELTPQGQEAAWTHPVGQRSSVLAERSLAALENGDVALANWYRRLSTIFLNRALSTVTGENQWHIVTGAGGEPKVEKVEPFQQPECYVTVGNRALGQEVTMPGEFTPLNWSTAELMKAVALNRAVAKRLETAYENLPIAA
jgi:hypothetical protein